ncbi:MAG: class II aldolase/adducin family protein [Rhodospirillales bacterium]|jgi:L-fuculose-phosphate aldolase|nr:class II aldolase/adducin family protein [Rhodospirillales bacterium]MBT4007299.1 class II aldolase/adducin family protein [Rhodospirillales bacterium]MBT5076996.1 class II aldolase/adducin family protein [Rhodospirillales bacterium]MBT5113632.1 class II aldolase/adducin family protein [Rhodospirillales bacterium]MBT5673930.1 class II aldolase/adducin family protein [Rhodospirillales bacterium]
MNVKSQDQDGRELVAKSCRMVGGLELTKATTGHVSQRSADGKHVLIRARGPDEVGVRYTTADEVITVDLDGKKVGGPDGLSVPQEVYIHTGLYKARPEVNSVIHIHPPRVVIFTICEKEFLPLYGAYDPSSVYLLLEGIPTYGRSITISNEELSKEFCAAMGQKNVCLMRGHGITTAGATVEEATMTAIKVNELAEMSYQAHLLGDPKPIPDEDIEHFKKSLAKRAGKPSPHATAGWRYYEKLSGA